MSIFLLKAIINLSKPIATQLWEVRVCKYVFDKATIWALNSAYMYLPDGKIIYSFVILVSAPSSEKLSFITLEHCHMCKVLLL